MYDQDAIRWRWYVLTATDDERFELRERTDALTEEISDRWEQLLHWRQVSDEIMARTPPTRSSR